MISQNAAISANYPYYGLIGVYGLTMAVGNFAFYAAIDRIPLGIAATLEFLGPLGIALLGSRRLLGLLWVALAAIGVTGCGRENPQA